jgi:hypothetical protein
MDLLVDYEGGKLWARGPERANLYFPKGERVALEATGPADFKIPGSRGDRLRFERSKGRVVGVTVNPGHWPQRGPLSRLYLARMARSRSCGRAVTRTPSAPSIVRAATRAFTTASSVA